MILSLLLLLQQFVTPSPIVVATPVPISERAMLDRGLRDAQAQARALHGTLGAAVEDLTTGVESTVDAQRTLPLGSVQNLAIATVAYREIDEGRLALSAHVAERMRAMLLEGDDAAASELTGALHGSDAVDAALAGMRLDGIFVAAHDGGTATPDALIRLLRQIETGSLLQPASNAALRGTLAAVTLAPGRLRAGLPPGARLEHQVGTIAGPGAAALAVDDAGIAEIPGHVLLIVAMLRDARGTPQQRDAVLAAVARAAVSAASVNPIAR